MSGVFFFITLFDYYTATLPKRKKPYHLFQKAYLKFWHLFQGLVIPP